MNLKFCLCCDEWTENSIWCHFCEDKITRDRERGPMQSSVFADHFYFIEWRADNGRFCSKTCRRLKKINAPNIYAEIAHELALQIQKKNTRLKTKCVLVPAPARIFGEKDHAWSIGMALEQTGVGVVCADLERVQSSEQKGLGVNDRLKKTLKLRFDSTVLRDYHIVFVDDVLTSGGTAQAAFDALGRPPNFTICTVFYRSLLRAT